jgi:tetratricopeptide (TPR) repeat protein
MKTAPILALCLLCSPGFAQDDFWNEDLERGNLHLLKGQLRRGESKFWPILLDLQTWKSNPESDRPSPEQVLRARVGLWTIDLRKGRFERILKGWQDPNSNPERSLGHLPGIEELTAAQQKVRDVALLRARVLAKLGRYEEAIAALAPCLQDPGDLQARYRLGTLQAEIGKHDEARETWQGAVDYANKSPVRDGESLAWLGHCLAAMGGRANIEKASQYLVDSLRVAPERPEALISRGILKFEVYGEADDFDTGEVDLKKVLEQNGEVEEALLALYRLRRTNYQLDPRRTRDYLERVIQLNPNSVPAIMEQAIVLVDDRRFEEGAERLDRALEINPREKRVLAHRAATAFLMHAEEDYRSLLNRALAVDPTFAGADRILADHLVALYRFADAIPFYRAVLEADADDVAALHGLAKALIYTGHGEQAVELLERAQSLQPGFVNAWRRNALAVEELLGQEYVAVETDGFAFRLHKEEQGVLAAYLLPLHQEARTVLGNRYQYLPEERVKVEVFHTWDDFSVRTIGFRGFTALGACFGPFLTLVSPGDGDLRRQDFMWAATVWHEYTHVLTLALSRHRVPRWLTEGISVYEERTRDPAWERGMKRELFNAFHNQEIEPVRLLNGMFRGPRILFGYYQGGLIVEHIAAQHGFVKVLEMLTLYGEDLATEEIFRRALGMSTGSFDLGFAEFVEKEKLAGMKLVPRLSEESINRLLSRVAVDPDDLEARVLLGWAYAHRNNPVDAGSQIREVLLRDPDHGRALLLHAEMLRQRGALADADAAYRKGFAAGAEDFDSRIQYGKLLQATDDLDGAMYQYQRAKGCWPDCTDQSVAPSLLLARVLNELERETEAMMELKIFCSRTARAFAPRLQLAAYEQKQGNRKLEAEYLEQALRIDPFMRELHLRLADAYEAIDRPSDAIAELEVALVVPPAMDRAWLADPASAPDPESEEERLTLAGISLRVARLHHRGGNNSKALDMLDKVQELAPGTEIAGEAQRLREQWR